jgi:addiction module RelE/StbE family toxin
MYEIYTANNKTERILLEYISLRADIKDKLERIKENPRRANGAHPLHGKFLGKWACWLGSNIRMIYTIDDKKRLITVFAVGTHKVY